AFCIGVYNRAAIQSPISYRTKHDVRFAPLGFTERMTAKEVLARHPKGRAYGHIHAGEDPLVLIDAAGTVLSLIPVTNSNDVGRVEPGHSQLFIEGTGTDQRLVEAAMQAMAASLALRGAKLGTVRIIPPTGKPFATPSLASQPVSVDPAAIRAAAGLPLPDAELRKLLERAGHTIIKTAARSWSLEAPFYRADLMHWRDIAEDVLISYGYNRIEPLPLTIASTGGLHPLTDLESRAAEAMAGLGFQEILTYTLTNREALERTQLPTSPVVEIANPVSATWSIFRTSLLPGLLSAFAQNQHQEYPQRIFEAGNVILPDPATETRARDELRLAAAVADSRVNYADLLAAALAFAAQFGKALVPRAHADPAFLPGRCALLTLDGKAIGILGEAHPHALTSWGIGKPVVAFELRLEPLTQH
ncbi:MAG TPA: phenylalanine--tRNA ligase subunit beta, partial [archaeon]|nr:phenylalanine--tRNA ligase subunit beta [archaeon]